MNNDTLDILRNADEKALKALETAIKTVKKEKYNARKEPADLQIKSVKTNLTEKEYQELVKKQCMSGYSKLSVFTRDIINNAVKVKPIILEASKEFFTKTSELSDQIKTIANDIDNSKALTRDEIESTLLVLAGLLREFQATRHLLVNSFTQEAAYEIAKQHLSEDKLVQALKELRGSSHDL
ncbi:chromosome partitioning protein ParA [Vibrio parahaemolyticus]|uniref:chromosome partitioning protein ParA n=1 Tax=Vibrio parahaemolyticus TaxID=670 RepID=UPI001B84113D|nr:chromosome partitioning protein ParA [Vibrio parahaemolyticus]EKO3695444.1 chromosome partitioning protein ParA [Vibrio metschnikovii]EKO3741989.1 chromosome partitioning protein ParA [Vibrio metschnikovii]EKO3743940.1 chromosome partitioning protein ParA [Vibrio metschnikovii]MCS0050729.1 chromosome partitioning protein ParA [Vibrio parahaemolyticus]MDF4637639.1 chromosome partitioning protein ParA [Vibrio parahaemolyticus]